MNGNAGRLDERSWLCYRRCLDTAAHCVQKGGRYLRQPLVGLLIECAQLAKERALAARSGAELGEEDYAELAETLERCAAHCGGFPEDQQLTSCGAICAALAESCRSAAGYPA